MKKMITRFLRFMTLLEQILIRFLADAGPQRAAGLAYSTLMAIVPLLAILIGFGGPVMTDESVQTFLANTLLPVMQEPIKNAILDFADNSKRLGLLGTPVFILTVLALLNNIEITLNHIFRVSTDRNLLQRIMTYTAVIIFAGMFIGASITLSGDMINLVLQKMDSSWIYPIFEKRMASFLFIFLGQFALLTLIPGRRVHPLSALLGAATGSILWELSKRLFGFWASQSVRLSVIYGSLFMVPLMLIWLLLVWIILLLVAELTYVHQHRSYFSMKRLKTSAPGEALINSLRLYSIIIRAFKDSRTPPDLTALSNAVNLPERNTENLLLPLLEQRILYKVILDKKRKGFVPVQPLKSQDLAALLQALCHYSNPIPGFANDPLIEAISTELSTCFYETNIEELLKKYEQTPPTDQD
ncbi:YihY/virulence factor BrkB family protein [Oceanispirochaeta sp.]|uniref:YihY/virulence factor BrkB family protein n=1 Tax=Oceanispirochaeta sp. TaxID=2035350 RepID=UPI002629B73E|nr:YhjD/YihY/BrkB family envelope integrity protein [Oceanispirochaeta sp.]MDA3956314.1 YihY family inner membrane protein [Oceanispirochaeta sp.]